MQSGWDGINLHIMGIKVPMGERAYNTFQSAVKEAISNQLKLKYMSDNKLTFGQQLVGLTFNPSGDEKVNKAKQLCAELADLVNDNTVSEAGVNVEQPNYLYNLIKGSALREILNAQMNVVKLLTLKY